MSRSVQLRSSRVPENGPVIASGGRAWTSRVLLLTIVAGAALAVRAGLDLVSDVRTLHDAGTVAMDDVVRGLLGAVLIVLGAWVGVGCVTSIVAAVIARMRGAVKVPHVPGIPGFLRDLSGRALRVGTVIALAAGPSGAATSDPTAVVPPTMVVVGAPPPVTSPSITAGAQVSASRDTPPSSTSTSSTAPRSTFPRSTAPRSTLPGSSVPRTQTRGSAAPGASTPASPVTPPPTASIRSAPIGRGTTHGDGAPHAGVREAPMPPRAADAPRSHVVRTGEHFWSIAENTVRESLGEEPSEAQTRGYWQRLIRANRSRLADPHDADLLIPGQVLDLPPLR